MTMTEKDYSGTVTGKIGKNSKVNTNLKPEATKIENIHTNSK